MKTVRDILGRHTIHPFPARMAPSIALEALEGADGSLRVLDPMAGSGTVLAVARASGHTALGIDSDPLAVLLSRVWTTAVDHESVLSKAREVLERAKKMFDSLPLRDAYPLKADDETRGFVRFWFDDYVRRQLTSLAAAIGRIHDAKTRDVLWCGFSRLIISKKIGVSRAMDLSHSRPHRVYDYGPIKPFSAFEAATRRVVENCPRRYAKGIGPPTSIRHGDARQLPFRTGSIDLVITSPPYLNAIDYLRCSKFSLVWMGFKVSDVRAIRSENIGTESAGHSPVDDADIANVVTAMCGTSDLSGRDERLLKRYVGDMKSTIDEVGRVLRPNARAVYVIGDSTLRGTFVKNSDGVTQLAEMAGLKMVSRSTRELPPNRRYLPPPSSNNAGENLQARMRTEVVLSFKAAT